MSIRSRIAKFEALSKVQGKDDNSNTKKRFKFPGSSTLNTESDTQSNFIRSSQNNIELQDFEADLQEVWSVRKNIRHTGSSNNITASNSSSALPGAQMKPGLYSRHGAIAAQQTRGSQVQPAQGSQVQPAAKDPFNRDYTSNASSWNVKNGTHTYSYNSQTKVDGVAKRPINSPHQTEASFIPAAKRRINVGGIDVIRPTKEPTFPLGDIQNDKKSYAKKMAKGYLKSVGMGEFTPKTTMYFHEEKQSAIIPSPKKSNISPSNTRWKKLDDDQEFEFDV